MEKQPTEEDNTGNSGSRPADDEKPPVLSSWNQLYGLVLLNLIVLIILFYLFTEAFS